MKTAACYIRVSTDEQEYSPDSQLKEIRLFCERNGLILLDEYIYSDEGKSGKFVKRRTDFQRMVTEAKRIPKPYDVLLLYKFSRFARNKEDSVVYKSILRKKCGIEVISVKEPLDPDNRMSKMIESIIECMDEIYSENLAEDVTRTMTEKASRGELQTIPPFGYTVKNNVLVAIPEEANLVQEIFSRFKTGDGYFAIARSLNDRGILTHRGNRFENRTIDYIIHNPVYIGKHRWTPTGRTRRDFSNPDSLVVDGKHEAIIDLPLWEDAQIKAQEIKAQWGKYKKPSEVQKHWLAGVIVCATCGATLCKGGEYFRCNNYAHGRCETSQAVTISKLEKLIIDRMLYDANSDNSISVKLIQGDGRPNELEIYQAKLKRIPERLKRAKDAYIDGIESLEEYKEIKTALEREKAEIEEEINRIVASLKDESHTQDMRNALLQAISALTSVDTEMSVKYAEFHKVAYKAILDRSNGNLEIEYQLTI